MWYPAMSTSTEKSQSQVKDRYPNRISPFVSELPMLNPCENSAQFDRKPPKLSMNVSLIVEFAGRFKDSGKSILNSGIPASRLANLINMIDKGTITGRMAKDVADDMLQHPGKDPIQIVAENPDYSPVSDHGEIEKIVNQVLAENPQSIIDFKAGRDKAFAFLVGQVMKLTKGKAPQQL